MFFFIIVILFSLTSCQNNDEHKKDLSELSKDTATFTSIKWIDSVQDIGVVEAGKKTEIKFRFKNIGQKPLLIVSAEPGCGCTVADYPKEPIAPATEGIVTAAYSVNAGTTGEFRKNIHVITNTKGTQSHYIYFYGKIRDGKDSTIAQKNIDTIKLREHFSFETKRNLLLKSTKN